MLRHTQRLLILSLLVVTIALFNFSSSVHADASGDPSLQSPRLAPGYPIDTVNSIYRPFVVPFLLTVYVRQVEVTQNPHFPGNDVKTDIKVMYLYAKPAQDPTARWFRADDEPVSDNYKIVKRLEGTAAIIKAYPTAWSLPEQAATYSFYTRVIYNDGTTADSNTIDVTFDDKGKVTRYKTALDTAQNDALSATSSLPQCQPTTNQATVDDELCPFSDEASTQVQADALPACAQNEIQTLLCQQALPEDLSLS